MNFREASNSHGVAATVSFRWSRSARDGHSYGLWVTMFDGSPVSYNDTFISHGVAKTVVFPWSRSGNSIMTYSSLYVYSSGMSSQVEPSHTNGVAYDHFCGRGV